MAKEKHLYTKFMLLARALDDYNKEYEISKERMRQELSHTFRLTKEDVNMVLAELEADGKICRKNKRDIKLL